MPTSRSSLPLAFALLLPVITAGCFGGADTSAGGGEPNGAGGGFESTEDDGGGGPPDEPTVTTASRSGGTGAGTDSHRPATADGFTMPECESGLTPLAFYLSADDSNSMGSPAIAREMLRAGLAPDPLAIRTYEFLNYYNVLYDLPDPAAGKLAAHLEMHDISSEYTDGSLRYRLQIGVQAFQIPRVPLVLTFVVDSSGSLVGEGIERERAAILAIGDQLRQGDVISIVKWANEDGVLLDSYVATGTPTDATVLIDAVSKLAPGGGSDLHAGLTKGYELAKSHFDATKLNRVVLISDGGANLGVLDRDVIASEAAAANDEGIYLVGVGVGPAQGYSDNLMNLVTDAGRGAYVFADSTEEAKSLFRDRFDEIMNVAARNVQVELDLPPYLEIDDFYGEEYSADPTHIEPQNLAPGDSMVFNQTLHLEDVEAACGLDTVTLRVKWETPLTHEPREVIVEPVTLSDLVTAEISPRMLKANAVIAYAEALKSATDASLKAALTRVEAAHEITGDADLEAIAALLKKHPALLP